MRSPLSSGLRSFWDARAADYDAKGLGDPGTYWRHTATNVLITRCEVQPGDVVLDLGCGTGNVVNTLAPHVKRALGVDISPKMLERARGRARELGSGAELREGDLLSAPRVPGLTHVTACFALTSLTERERLSLYERVHSMLNTGGMFVIADLFWSLPPEQVEADFFEEQWMQSVSAHKTMAQLEDKGRYRVLLEPLHPLVSVLTAVKL